MYNIKYEYNHALAFRKKIDPLETRKSSLIQAILVTMGQRPLSTDLLEKFRALESSKEYFKLIGVLNNSDIVQTIQDVQHPYIQGYSPFTDGEISENTISNPDMGYCKRKYGAAFVQLVLDLGGSPSFAVCISRLIKEHKALSSHTGIIGTGDADMKKKLLMIENDPKMSIIKDFYKRVGEIIKNSNPGDPIPPKGSYFGSSKVFNGTTPLIFPSKHNGRHPTPGSSLRLRGDKKEQRESHYFTHDGVVTLECDQETCQTMIDMYKSYGKHYAKIEDGGLFYLKTPLDEIDSPLDLNQG